MDSVDSWICVSTSISMSLFLSSAQLGEFLPTASAAKEKVRRGRPRLPSL
jgi:hypothetical protein